MLKKIFDNHHYCDAQIIEAFTCPINRDCTRKEHNCDDWHLYKNPKLLIKHFIENGEAIEFAKRREEFMKEIEVYDDYII